MREAAGSVLNVCGSCWSARGDGRRGTCKPTLGESVNRHHCETPSGTEAVTRRVVLMRGALFDVSVLGLRDK